MHPRRPTGRSAAGGKAELTVAHVPHSAGLISVPGYDEFLGPNREGWNNTGETTRRLAAAVPEWPPGTAHGYHDYTYGWLVAEIARRAAGVTIGTVLRKEIAEPLGIELDLGTPIDKQHLVAPVLASPSGVAAVRAALAADPSSPAARMQLAVDGNSPVTNTDSAHNQPDHLAMEMAASNATATARAVATLYGALANDGTHDGVRILSPATIEKFAAERCRGTDRVVGTETRWGLGFLRPAAEHVWGPHDETFGSLGGGVQMTLADPVSRIGFGFVRNEFLCDPQLGGLLVDAVYECL